jgi:hypothetical protein
MTKLDMSKAWDNAMGMLSKNRELMLVLGGVFIFLPTMFVSFVTAGSAIDELAGQEQPSQAQLMEALISFLAEFWWVLILTSLIQSVGLIAIIRTLGHNARPTVIEAISSAAKLAVTLILAEFLTGMAFMAVPALGYLVGGGIGGLLTLAALPLVLYLLVKFWLVEPVIALEEQRNPLEAMRQSWAITRGNSARLLAFLALLMVAGLVIYSVAAMLLGLALSLGSEALQATGTNVLGAAASTVYYLIAGALVVAVYKQLSGHRPLGGAEEPQLDADS